MKNIKLVPKILAITILILSFNSLQLKANEVFQQKYEYNQVIEANKTNSLVTVFLKKGDIINTSLQTKNNDDLKLQVPIKNSSGIYSHIINFVDSNTNSYVIKEDSTYTFCIYNPNSNKEVEYQLVISINNISSTTQTKQQDIQVLEKIQFDKFSSKNEIWYGPFDLNQNDSIQSKFSWLGEQDLNISIIKDDPSQYNQSTVRISLIQNNAQDIFTVSEDGHYYFILSSTPNDDINTVTYLQDINGYFSIK